MPHATLPSSGFQALILCGPGASLDTFTSNPSDFPKALVPVANRPMVWYPLDWCYRMGVSTISLITPPESQEAIEAALSQNPYLTSLPAPRPDVIAPKALTMTSGTAEIFRLPEVYDAISGDFIVLPCDLVCELDGLSLLETWMVQCAGFGGATGGRIDSRPIPLGAGGEKIGRRGGLGLWYDTKGDNGIKGQETDFLATTPLPKSIVPPAEGSLRPSTEKVVLSMPTDTLNDITDEEKAFPIRQNLLRKHGRIKMHTTLRDAHVYFLPYWVLQMMKSNETFDNINEDVLGWWTKATWQEGLAEKLGLRDILDPTQPHNNNNNDNDTNSLLTSEVDIASLSTTHRSISQPTVSNPVTTLASRVHSSPIPAPLQPAPPLPVPPLLATLHTSSTSSSAILVRRTDTTPSLLATSLSLALLAPPSPLAHPQKIASPDSIPSQARISTSDTLIDANTTIAAKTTIKECVIGARCVVGSGARLTRCVLFEEAEVFGDAQLTGCVLGKGCKVEGGAGKRTVLWDCEIGHGFVVPEGTEARGEKFVAGQGLEEGLEEEEDEIGDVEDMLVSEG